MNPIIWEYGRCQKWRYLGLKMADIDWEVAAVNGRMAVVNYGMPPVNYEDASMGDHF